MTGDKKKLGKQIVPYVTKVALVRAAANGATELLLKQRDADPVAPVVSPFLRPGDVSKPSLPPEQAALMAAFTKR